MSIATSVREQIEEIIEKKGFMRLSQVKEGLGLADLLEVKDSRNSIRKALFENGYLTENIPIEDIIKGIHAHGASINPYLNSDIVGKEKVEEHREIVLQSEQFKTYINERYSSLSEVRQKKGLANLLGVEYAVNPIRRALFENGYLTEMPVQEVIDDISAINVNPYLNPEIVGKKKVEEHRNKVIKSEEFRNYISGKYSSLSEVRLETGLATLLGTKYNQNSIRKALFENGCLTEIPVDKIIKNIHTHGASINPYLNPDIVGKKKVEEHRNKVIKSEEFRNYISGKYSSLSQVKEGLCLANLLEVKESRNSIRKALFENGCLTEVPVQEIVDSINKMGRGVHLYLNLKIVGKEKVEEHRKKVIKSEEFMNYINEKYSSLSEIGREAGLATLLGVEHSISNVRKALFENNCLVNVPVQEIVDKINSTHISPYMDPEIVGKEKVEEHRKKILKSKEFKGYIRNRYSSPSEVGREYSLATLLGVKLNQNSIRNKLIELGIFDDMPVYNKYLTIPKKLLTEKKRGGIRENNHRFKSNGNGKPIYFSKGDLFEMFAGIVLKYHNMGTEILPQYCLEVIEKNGKIDEYKNRVDFKIGNQFYEVKWGGHIGNIEETIDKQLPFVEKENYHIVSLKEIENKRKGIHYTNVAELTKDNLELDLLRQKILENDYDETQIKDLIESLNFILQTSKTKKEIEKRIADINKTSDYSKLKKMPHNTLLATVEYKDKIYQTNIDIPEFFVKERQNKNSITQMFYQYGRLIATVHQFKEPRESINIKTV